MADQTASSVLFLHALTGVHPGAGQALGDIDLPVQRERHTGWPTIPGSTLKGILRDACAPPGKRDDEGYGDNPQYRKWTAVFGPEPPRGAQTEGVKAPADTADKRPQPSDFGGALSVSDARILAFPVRSLKGVFAWVTCPAALERFKRDLGLAGAQPPWSSPVVADAKALFGEKLELNGKMVLEEFDFENAGAPDTKLTGALTQALEDQPTAERLRTHLAIVDDSRFTHLVKYATEVVQRISLNYETKTVASGALFSIEFLPPETIMYALLFAAPSRDKNLALPPGQVLNSVTAVLHDRPIVQVGGDETIGKGLCALKLLNGKAGAQ